MSKLLIQFTAPVIIFLEEIETFSEKDIYFILKLTEYSQISPEDFNVLIWDVELDKTKQQND